MGTSLIAHWPNLTRWILGIPDSQFLHIADNLKIRRWIILTQPTIRSAWLNNAIKYCVVTPQYTPKHEP